MRRKTLAAGILILFAALMASSTLAYFTAEDRAVNVITLGSVDIEIVEYDHDGNVISATYSEEEPVMPGYFNNVEPGMRIVKKVTIQNRGKSTAWVRAKILDDVYSAEGEPLSDSILRYNVNDLKTVTAEETEPGKAPEGYTYNLNGEWKNGGDGYWYYTVPLKVKETAILFDVVTFDGPSMGNRYQGCETNIQILAQATQYDGNENCLPESWPAEPEPVNPLSSGADENEGGSQQ